MPSPEALIHRPELLAPQFQVATLGDIRIDVRAQVADLPFTDIRSDHQESGQVVVELGGTAMNFARAAEDHFADVHVIGAMGQDSWSEYIRTRCEEEDFETCLTEVQQPNSVVVVLRDRGGPHSPHGVRLLVADDSSPYQCLTAEVAHGCRETIESSDALVVDGYALLAEGSAEALDVAVEYAVAAGVPVCFDVVPHTIDQELSLAELEPFLVRSSLITVEVATLLRLLGRPVPTQISREDVVALAEGLPAHVAGWQRTWFLRFGYGQMDEVCAISPTHHQVYYRTGYAEAVSPAGYGYTVTAAELKWWLTNYVRATQLYPTLARKANLVSAERFRAR